MDKLLPVLAVETSGDMCSVAVLQEENSFVEMNFLQKHIHSKKIIGMIDSVLNESGCSVNDLKAVAVSCGPGSFTGLRIGFSAVKGLALGANLPVISVPTYDALAFQISQNLQEGTEFIVANKAGVEEIYISKNKVSGKRNIILQKVESILKKDLMNYCGDVKFLFGNSCDNPIQIYASSIAKWAYLFGSDLLTFDYDYLEPEYFGNPFLKKLERKGE